MYLVENGTKTSNTATVTITVTPKILDPIAVNDAYTVAQDSGETTLTPAVSANDQGTHVATFLETPPAHGTVPAGVLTYTPNAGFSGTDTFTYSFQDAATGNSSNVATVTITVTPSGGGGGGEEDVVDVGADCSGNVTFTNLLDEEVNVRYGPNVSLEGEFDLAAGQSETITTSSKVLTFLAANATHGESGSIEIPTCSNGGGDEDHSDEGDKDDGDEGDDRGKHHHGHLPDTGSPFARTGLLGAWLLLAGGSYLIVRSRRRVA